MDDSKDLNSEQNEIEISEEELTLKSKDTIQIKHLSNLLNYQRKLSSNNSKLEDSTIKGGNLIEKTDKKESKKSEKKDISVKTKDNYFEKMSEIENNENNDNFKQISGSNFEDNFNTNKEYYDKAPNINDPINNNNESQVNNNFATKNSKIITHRKVECWCCHYIVISKPEWEAVKCTHCGQVNALPPIEEAEFDVIEEKAEIVEEPEETKYKEFIDIKCPFCSYFMRTKADSRFLICSKCKNTILIAKHPSAIPQYLPNIHNPSLPWRNHLDELWKMPVV